MAREKNNKKKKSYYYPWKYEGNKYWRTSKEYETLETKDIQFIPSKKHFKDSKDSLSLYGICVKPETHETHIEKALSHRKQKPSKWMRFFGRVRHIFFDFCGRPIYIWKL